VIELRSLSSRLIVYWICGLALVYASFPVLSTLATSVLFAGHQHIPPLAGWTTKRARLIVLDAVRADESGRSLVELTDELRAYLAKNPEFRFAVIDPRNRTIIPGSSRELGSHFEHLYAFDEVYFGFRIEGDSESLYGYAVSERSPKGKFHIVAYGSYFQWEDLEFQLIHMDRNRDDILFPMLAIVMAAFAWIVIRRGLAPLHGLAMRVAAIDIDSLDQRLSEAGQPTEALPFIAAVNKAFERVKEGVERQRRFTANSAHELRTPLTILRSRIETLEESPIKHELDRDARRMETIVEQLLVLAQLKERAHAPAKIVDLNRLVLQVTTDYAPIAIDNDKNIELDAPSREVLASGYDWAIECIVTNLVENAIRAEPPDGTVLVRLDENAAIEVVDHGNGVPPAERDLIFEPFWRRDSTTPGSGLGLSIVKELVQLMGGMIRLRDTPGGGATFEISLPNRSRIAETTPGDEP
jgi:signal transduction histidine kinase